MNRISKLLIALLLAAWLAPAIAQETTTSNLGLTLPEAPAGSWGAKLNTNFTILDTELPKLGLSCMDTQIPKWSDAQGKFVCAADSSGPHAGDHQHAGADEIATATPGANAIPKAGAAGTLADGWLSSNIPRLNGNNAFTGTNSVHGGTKFSILDPTDPTKQMRFDLSGLSVSSIRNLSPLDKDYTVEETGHGAKHKHGGSDEIASATPAANAIPKAGAGGVLDPAWLAEALHSSFDDPDHDAINCRYTAASGSPGAGTVASDCHIYVDTSTSPKTLWYGSGSGNNFEEVGALGDAYNQITVVGGGAVSASGSETLQLTPGKNITITETAGSPDDVTIAQTNVNKSITYIAGCDNCSALADADDQATFWRNNIGAMTITEVWCQTDQGTSVINLQRNDGTPANILSSNLTCDTTGATGTIATAEDNVADGDKLDFVLVTAAATGAPQRITVNIEATLD